MMQKESETQKDEKGDVLKMVLEIGRVCIKTAGRDAGKHCVVIDMLDNNVALIDGATRRRKCNILHLEPTARKVDISKDADHEAVKKAFSQIGIDIKDTAPKKAGSRPSKQPRKKEYPAEKKKKKPKEAQPLKDAEKSKVIDVVPEKEVEVQPEKNPEQKKKAGKTLPGGTTVKAPSKKP